MPVRIGQVELTAVQALYTEENRSLVEQQVPGQAGNVFQDLGRGPVAIVLEGLILGEGAPDTLERLRKAHADADPLPFGSDIAVGSDITEVLIADFEARQVAGYLNCYVCTMRIREYVEPPESAAASLAAVDAGVAADADNWADGALGAASGLQDPGNLPGLLGEQPGILSQLDIGDLGESLVQNLESLTGGNFTEILSAIGEIDPAKVVELVNTLKDADSLGDFIQKLADEGLDILEELTGIDLDTVGAIIKGIAGAAEFLQRLQAVTEAASQLVDDLRDFDLLAGVRPFLPED